MKKLILFFMIFILSPQCVWANAKTQLERVNNGKVINPAFQQHLPEVNKIKEDNKLKEDNKIVKDKKVEVKDKKSNSKMTNYQYDEANYHYYKVQKYIQSNLDYSQSGRMKY